MYAPLFTAASFTAAHTRKQPRWLDKEVVLHAHDGYYAAVRGDETLPFATTRTDPENTTRGKISQTAEGKSYMISLIRGI